MQGMCNHCYHKYGRNSFATACVHTDRLIYAKGKCQNCYLNEYNKEKRQQRKGLANPSSNLKPKTNEGDQMVLSPEQSLEPSTKRRKVSGNV